MRQLISLMIVAVLLTATAAIAQSETVCDDSSIANGTCALTIDSPDYCFGRANSFCLSWRVVNSAVVYFRLNVQTINAAERAALTQTFDHGWAGIMFGAKRGMINGSLVRVTIDKNGVAVADDMYSAGYFQPTVINRTSVIAVTGNALDDGLNVTFARKCAPDNAAAVDCTGDTITLVSWAYNFDGSGFAVHKAGTHGEIRIIISQNKLITSTSIESAYSALAIMLASILALGFIGTHFLPLNSTLYRCCHYRRFSSPIIGSFMSQSARSQRLETDMIRAHKVAPFDYSFGVLPMLYQVSYGQMFLFLMYLATLITFFSVGWAAFVQFYGSPQLMFGHLTSISLALTLLPVARMSSLFQFVFQLPFERAVQFHRINSRIAVCAVIIHMSTMISQYGSHIIWLTDDTEHGNGIAWGFITAIFMLIMLLTSLSIIRRYYFNLFYLIHLSFVFPIIIFAAVHSTFFRYSMLLPAAIYIFDVFYRNVRWFRRDVKLVDIKCFKGDVDRLTRLTLHAPAMRFEAGQYAFICLPAMTPLQWHPFSIVTDQDTAHDHVHLYCLDMGKTSWTHQLADIADARQQEALWKLTHPNSNGDSNGHRHSPQSHSYSLNSRHSDNAGDEHEMSAIVDNNGEQLNFDSEDSDDADGDEQVHMEPMPFPVLKPAFRYDLQVYLDGPYGNISVDIQRYNTIVIVAGGIGITPFITLLYQTLRAVNEHKQRRRPSKTLTSANSLTSAYPSSSSSAASVTKHIYLIWTTRNIQWMTQVFSSLMILLNNDEHFTIFAYDTHQSNHSEEDQLPLRHIMIRSITQITKFTELLVVSGRPDISSLFTLIEDEHRSGNAAERKALTVASTGVNSRRGADGMSAAHEAAMINEMIHDIDDRDDDIIITTADETMEIGRREDQSADNAVEGDNDSVCVLSCGPPALTAAARTEAAVRSFAFHEETFLL